MYVLQSQEQALGREQGQDRGEEYAAYAADGSAWLQRELEEVVKGRWLKSAEEVPAIPRGGRGRGGRDGRGSWPVCCGWDGKGGERV
jgi:hypothetical protein